MRLAWREASSASRQSASLRLLTPAVPTRMEYDNADDHDDDGDNDDDDNDDFTFFSCSTTATMFVLFVRPRSKLACEAG